ncbi:hypothetical protein GGF44_006705, partial [Coemansia sp. RSA 1694]
RHVPRQRPHCPQGRPQGPALSQAAPVDYPRNRPHPPGRPFPRKACCLPEAAQVGSASGHWPLQDQRRAPAPRQPGLRHCHLHQGRPCWPRRRRQVRRCLLQARGADQAEGHRGGVLWRQGSEEGAPRPQNRRPEDRRQGRPGRCRQGPLPRLVPELSLLPVQGPGSPHSQVL